MNPERYQREASMTEPVCGGKISTRAGTAARLLHHALGIGTEAGELQDALKRHIYYGIPFDRTNLVEELGDLMWYIAGMCNTLDTSLEEVMFLNNAKLKERYQGGFSEERAVKRDLEKEREILES